MNIFRYSFLIFWLWIDDFVIMFSRLGFFVGCESMNKDIFIFLFFLFVFIREGRL